MEYFEWAKAVVDGLPQVSAELLGLFNAAYAARLTIRSTAPHEAADASPATTNWRLMRIGIAGTRPQGRAGVRWTSSAMAVQSAWLRLRKRIISCWPPT